MCLQQFQLTSFIQASLVAQTVKNLPAMQETWIQSLSREDPRAWLSTLVFLPGESHGQRSPEGHSPWGCKESDTTEQLSMHTDSFAEESLI